MAKPTTVLKLPYRKVLSFGIFILIMLYGSNQLLAQEQFEDEPAEYFVHSLGAGAGFTTGYGLSYRYTPTRFGAQINFAPYKDDQTSRYSLGLTFLYTLIRNQHSTLYLYQANHYFYDSQMTWVTHSPQSPNVTYGGYESGSYFNNGVGFGIEFIILKRVGFNLMGGYAAYENFSKLNFTGETALYYKF